MMKRVVLALSVAVFLAANPARAAVINFETVLAPEIAGSSGFGDALVTYDSVAQTLLVSFSFSNLTGTTTVAHIHCCVNPPGTVGVAVTPGTFPGFPVGLTSGSYDSPFLNLTLESTYTTAFRNNFGGGTVSGAEAALVAGMLAGRAYLNVHSTFAPGGEIRGFLVPVPEPATLTLVGGALAAMVARRRRSRRLRPEVLRD